MAKAVAIGEFVAHFGLIVLSGYGSLNKRMITDITVNRPGFELCGFFESTVRERLVLIGNKEMNYIAQADKKQIEEAFEFLTNEKCPGIVITRNNECPLSLLNIAKKKDFPILSTAMSTTDLIVSSFTYLQDKLAPSESFHASLVEIYSQGVLILGESGIGKSETTLELVKKGHRLVSDDRVDVSLVHGELIGRAPDLIYGVMEVRGIGIINVGQIFGINSLLKEKHISYAIKLVAYNPEHHYDRLGNNPNYMDILGVKIPVLSLPVSGARSMSEIIEVAITNLKLKDAGQDSTFEFEARMNELLARKQG